MLRSDSFIILSILAIAAFPFSRVQAQNTLYVDNRDLKATNAALGTRPGAPLRTINRAIEKSANGDEIMVAPGVYHELINFSGKAITIRASKPDDPLPTIIDASGVPDPGTGTPVVRCDSGAGPDTVLDGFTIRNGGGSQLLSAPGALRGGGMFIVNSSPTVLNCIFESNNATNAGGVFISGGSPTFIDCEFRQNDADRNGGGMEAINGSRVSLTGCKFIENKTLSVGADGTDGHGGGIMSNDSVLFLTDCTFSENKAVGRGGGIYSVLSNHVVTHCKFDRNESVAEGGGMYNLNSRPRVTRTFFAGNRTTGPNGHGAGMYNIGSSPMLYSCVFSGNSASGPGAEGGGMFNVGDSNPTVVNSTFANNTATTLPGQGLVNRHGVTTLTNCIFWASAPSSGATQVFNDWATVIRFSDIQGIGGIMLPTVGTDDGGNIDDDPRFVADDGADGTVGTLDDELWFLPGSPAVDAGTSIGTLLDIDGRLRIAGDPSTPDTGVGFPYVIDMGAYEFLSEFPTGSPDVDLDGDVDLDDFALLEAAFTGPDPCVAVCGNGILECSEACDDGDILPGDGCDENCQIQMEIPANDECVDAIEIFDGSTPFDTYLATQDGPPVGPECDPIASTTQISADIWYRYVATCDGTVEVSLCGSDYDTKLAVYDGTSCPPIGEVDCNDDGCDDSPLDEVSSLGSSVTNHAVTIGQELTIRIGGYTDPPQGTGMGMVELACDDGNCNAAAGACYDANGSPGCSEPDCCYLVCDDDAVCCDRGWDDVCAERAAGVCGLNCGTGGVLIDNNACDRVAGPFAGSPDGGCRDEQTCLAVCAIESDCCRFEWDLECVCLAAPAEPCCQAICLQEPSCCSTGWTPACDVAADSLSPLCPP